MTTASRSEPRPPISFLVAMLMLMLSAAAGYASVSHVQVMLLLVTLPIGLFFFVRPAFGVVVAVLTLPVLHPLLGHEGGSAVVTASDAVLLAVAAGCLPLWLLTPAREDLRTLKPMVFWVAPFGAWLVVLLAAHHSGHSAFKTMTAVEMTFLPLALGATLLTRQLADVALNAFLVCAAILGVIWIVTGGQSSFAGNKNYAGQFLAEGAILAVVLGARRSSRNLILPVVLTGLLFAASRGAIVGLAFGLIALLAIRGLGSWKRTAATVTALSLVFLVTYNTVPSSVQQRLASISRFSADSSGTDDSASGSLSESLAYNVRLRTSYREDGLALVDHNRLLGVGIGNYVTGAGVTQTADPHNLLIKTAGEAGIPGLVAFIAMTLGSAAVVLRRLGRNPWAGPAIAMQVAIITHSMVDVYWVRGIPVLGWLLIGMALNPKLDHEQAEPA